MSTPLNPLVVARLRKYWRYPNVELGRLLDELDGWIYILGPGPATPICDSCRQELSFNWTLCKYCSHATAICHACIECYNCQQLYASPGCCECGVDCGAYMCQECKILNQS